MANLKKPKDLEEELQEWYKEFLKLSTKLRDKENGGLIGKYFVLRDGKVVGHYDTFDTAYRSCLEQYDDQRFLIQELVPEDYNNFVYVSS